MQLTNLTKRQLSSRRRSILVTGMPRSGTTWLARLLSCAPHTALAGGEPMNPRGNQFALGHTLSGWARVSTFTPQQQRTLRLAYSGLIPGAYSRYGHRQWAAPLPTTRLVVKDPFAMLSLPAVVKVTAARPILVYRHPGAVLSSYRRMGWTPDLDEIAPLVAVDSAGPEPGHLPGCEAAAEMARFWVALNRAALADLRAIPDAIIVSHEDVALGGNHALARLFELCGLPWNSAVERAIDRAGSASAASADRPPTKTLHDFSRSPAQVAGAWRAKVSLDELKTLEHLAGGLLSDLEAARANLT